MEGTVKWFNRAKGFGFIVGEDGVEYFVHHSALAQGKFLKDNDKVSFDPVDTERGKQSQNVVLLQKGSEMEGAEAPAEAAEEAPAEKTEEPAEEVAEEAPAEEPVEEAAPEAEESKVCEGCGNDPCTCGSEEAPAEEAAEEVAEEPVEEEKPAEE